MDLGLGGFFRLLLCEFYLFLLVFFLVFSLLLLITELMLIRYTSEISPSGIRGMMTSTMNTGLAVGLLVAYWVRYGALNISGTAAWRMCFSLQLIPGALDGIIIFFRPESPRWLFHHDRSEEALQVLADLHANGNRDDAVVRAEYEEIRVVVEFERGAPPPSYFTLLFGKQTVDAQRWVWDCSSCSRSAV